MADAKAPAPGEWGAHAYRAGSEEHLDVESPDDPKRRGTQRDRIEPWLSAVFQSEHLSLLLGSGFTKAVALAAGASAAGMGLAPWEGFAPYGGVLEASGKAYAARCQRGAPNIEDQIRAVQNLLEGARIMAATGETDWQGAVAALGGALGSTVKGFADSIVATEEGIHRAIGQASVAGGDGVDALVLLQAFLLSFASRSASRERLHILTTNYDRLIEYGADLAGLHVLDRFVGTLEPRFRSSRLDIDMHYNPPGIRGEPRYLEGVVQLTKLHGSLDWRVDERGWVRKVGIPFGSPASHPALQEAAGTIMIYPNAAKDRETAEYPYVDLFRDFAAAVCRPNSALVTYGYGFGDDHINRVLGDMLTIPSTHLVIISYSDEEGRVSGFCRAVGRKAQISLLIGPHFGSLPTLVEHYLPKPAIDRITMRQTELLRHRNPLQHQPAPSEASTEPPQQPPPASGPATGEVQR